MSRHPYTDYVTNDALHEKYSSYQERYADEPRESDKVLIELVRELAARPEAPERPVLLDVGCSTGNLVRHLKRALPDVQLIGADLAANVLEACRRDPELAGIEFRKLDLLDLGVTAPVDIIVANAVLYLLGDNEFERAIASVSRGLPPGGWFLAFDFFHSFAQDLTILERSQTHPEGLTLHFRSFSTTHAAFERAGFESPSFRPFEIPIDLPKGSTYSSNLDGFEDLNSYTVRAESGERLLFRGTLFQPWCHLVARKGRP